MKLNVEITNLAEFITATEVVLKKAEELQKAIPVLEEILKNDNDGKKLEKINDYLIDNADDRSFSEFLCELR